jgi:WD40 repeat protein
MPPDGVKLGGGRLVSAIVRVFILLAAVTAIASAGTDNGPLLVTAVRDGPPYSGRLYVVSEGVLKKLADREFTFAARIAPGGKLVAFESGRCGGQDQVLEVVRVDGTRGHRIASADAYGHGGNSVCTGIAFAWDAEGKRLAVILPKHGIPHLRTLTPAGRILSDVELPYKKRPNLYTITYYNGLSWSPDGQWVGTELGRGGGYVGYLLMHPDGSARRLIFRTYEYHDFPVVSWSPDGTQLAIVTEGRLPRDPNVAVFDVRSGTMRDLHLEHATSADWSPDSRRLVLSVYDRGVLIVTTAGKIIRTISRPQARSALWSPDGQTIAFIDGKKVVEVSAAGGSPRVVAALPPQWKPDRLSWAHG